MKYQDLREEELKNKIAQDYFGEFDCTQIIGNIDFCVAPQPSPLTPEGGVAPQPPAGGAAPQPPAGGAAPPNPALWGGLKTPPVGNGGLTPLPSGWCDVSQRQGAGGLLWAEAKKGSSDIYKSIVQLILTIGKARTFEKVLPPSYLGAFDAEKIAFIPYSEVQEIFYQNDFNWNVAPSNHETKEFKQVFEKVKTTIDNNTLLFFFEKDDKELHEFIKLNFIAGKSTTSKIRIDKNNFITIYTKWLADVKPTIVLNWEIAKKNGIIDGDFYLADLLSLENETLKDKLYVLLKKDYYELDKILDEMGMFQSRKTFFNDKQKAHTQFWNIYERPPKEQYWDYIVERRDLLVPQDVRERKGSFFTPQIWVELSQQYLAEVLGEDWQDEYYIWDCAAGTGNLLAGLTNKRRIFASTLDRQDIDVIKDRIQNGANLLADNVFQFDFLNDDFKKLPQTLQEVINNPEKRKKLVIYINPPYAEASNRKTLTSRKEGNRGVEQNKINEKYANYLGQGNAELFAQFLTRIYFELNGVMIGNFSKVKILNGQHFINFRNFFLAKLEKAFVIPANTFDNVKGQFPIGFMVWNTNKKEQFEEIIFDVYAKNKEKIGIKTYFSYNNSQYINDWLKPFRAIKEENGLIGKIPFKGNDFQNQNLIALVHHKMDYNVEAGQFLINRNNLLQACIYFAVRKCIKATWLNDRDQFLYPNEKWQTDKEFQHDCLAYTLFTNTIKAKFGTNHWIPFTEDDVNARQEFESNFMTKFMAGKLKDDTAAALFEKDKVAKKEPLTFSAEAQAVFAAGKALWIYYHEEINKIPLQALETSPLGVKGLVNAALYDIREHFQGRNSTGKMNNKSTDKKYNELLGNLREALEVLAKKIEPKVYEYGFLKG